MEEKYVDTNSFLCDISLVPFEMFLKLPLRKGGWGL
jgi:hypothetical protein